MKKYSFLLLMIFAVFSCTKEIEIRPQKDSVANNESRLEVRQGYNRLFVTCNYCKTHGDPVNPPPGTCSCGCVSQVGNCVDDVVITATKAPKVEDLLTEVDQADAAGISSVLSSDRTLFNSLFYRSGVVDSLISGDYQLNAVYNPDTEKAYFKVSDTGTLILVSPAAL